MRPSVRILRVACFVGGLILLLMMSPLTDNKIGDDYKDIICQYQANEKVLVIALDKLLADSTCNANIILDTMYMPQGPPVNPKLLEDLTEYCESLD